MEKINVTVTPENGELVIRQGTAIEQREPHEMLLKGNLEAPAEWFETKAFDKKLSYVVIDKKQLMIQLKIRHDENYFDTITGTITLSEKLENLNINNNKMYSSQELSQQLKFYRMYFPDKERHMKIIAELQNLKGSVVTNFEKSNDLKGNKKYLFEQELKKQFDLSFTLSVPLFSGYENVTFSVDVNYEVTDGDVRFWLESVELEELKETFIDRHFESVVKRLSGITQITV